MNLISSDSKNTHLSRCLSWYGSSGKVVCNYYMPLIPGKYQYQTLLQQNHTLTGWLLMSAPLTVTCQLYLNVNLMYDAFGKTQLERFKKAVFSIFIFWKLLPFIGYCGSFQNFLTHQPKFVWFSDLITSHLSYLKVTSISAALAVYQNQQGVNFPLLWR